MLSLSWNWPFFFCSQNIFVHFISINSWIMNSIIIWVSPLQGQEHLNFSISVLLNDNTLQVTGNPWCHFTNNSEVLKCGLLFWSTSRALRQAHQNWPRAMGTELEGERPPFKNLTYTRFLKTSLAERNRLKISRKEKSLKRHLSTKYLVLPKSRLFSRWKGPDWMGFWATWSSR